MDGNVPAADIAEALALPSILCLIAKYAKDAGASPLTPCRAAQSAKPGSICAVHTADFRMMQKTIPALFPFCRTMPDGIRFGRYAWW